MKQAGAYLQNPVVVSRAAHFEFNYMPASPVDCQVNEGPVREWNKAHPAAPVVPGADVSAFQNSRSGHVPKSYLRLS